MGLSREEKNRKQREWRAANPDKVAAMSRRYREKNLDKIKAKEREYYSKNKDRYKPRTEEERLERLRKNREWRLAQYGLTPEDYETMLADQNGLCAICQNPEPVHANLAVDHCHYSGKVRGLLCCRCNPAVGALGDTPELLQRAVDYLSRV